MSNQKKFFKIFISSVIVLLVLVVTGYFAYPTMSTRLAIRHTIKETDQQLSPESYSKLKSIDIQKIYQTVNPLEYWVVATRLWKDDGKKESRTGLIFVSTAENQYNHLADLTKFSKIDFISPEKTVVIYDLNPDVNPRWKSVSIYRSDEGNPKWVLTALSDYYQENGGLQFRFRNKNEQYGSGDDYLRPLFDGGCENDITTNKFEISLLGVQLKNKYNSNLQNVYFQNPIEVECKEYEDPFTGKGYIPPVNNSLDYEEPHIITTLPGNITLKIDADKLRTGTEADWSDAGSMISAFQNETKIKFKNSQSE